MTLLRQFVDSIHEWRARRTVLGLIAQGMKVGRNVLIIPSAAFDAAYPWLIEIGDDCRISRGVRILAHDATSFFELGVTRLGRVRILEDTFIGEYAIVLPGVTIGPRAMVAAGSVVSRDVGEVAMVAGNPARVYGRYDEYLDRTKAKVKEGQLYAATDLMSGRISRSKILESLSRGEPVHVTGAPGGSQHYFNAFDHELQDAFRTTFERHFGAPDDPPVPPPAPRPN